ncbi:MAG TPA: hypothetical protein VF549_13535 [Solirubrobacteraceae bacterium]|jgi:alpha-tubulin suppressor-like RCC1 family protein
MPRPRSFLLAMALLFVAAAPAAADPSFSPSLAAEHGKLDAGSTHSCAVLAGGVVRCWGEGAHGKLGTGATEDVGDFEHPASAPPVALGPGRTALAVSAGDEHSCALLDTHDVRCWGMGADGRLGTGNSADVGDDEAASVGAIVDLGPHTAKAISLGADHACAIVEDDSLRCWGSGDRGQLGYGATADVLVPAQAGPVPLPAGRSVRAVSAGGDHTCAILDDFTLRCWGAGAFGITGHGNQDNVTAADGNNALVYLGAGRSARSVSIGDNHACAILDDATVRCWGIGSSGALGYGNEANVGDDEAATAGGPVSLGAGRTAKAIAVGQVHTCAILDDDTMRCWGLGAYGEQGVGERADVGDDELPSDVPVIPRPSGRAVVALAPGAEFSCWRLDDGNVRCTGWNYYGQAGTASANPTFSGVSSNETRTLAAVPDVKFSGAGTDVSAWVDPQSTDAIAVGGKRTIEVAVVNAGPDAVSGVQVALEPSAGLTLSSPASAVWDVGTLAPGVVKTVQAQVTGTVAGARQLGVQVTDAGSPDADSTPGNGVAAGEDDDAAAPVTVVPGSDLSVDVDMPAGDLVRPAHRTATITVRNDGPSPVSGVEVDVDFGDHRYVAGSTPSQGTYDSLAGWNAGTLASGASATLTLDLVPTAAGADPVKATVKPASEPDPDAADRTDSQALAVVDGADLEIALGGAGPALAPGQHATLTLLLFNREGGASTDAAVDLDVPAGLEVVGVSRVAGAAWAGAYDAATHRLTMDDLLSTSSVTFGVTVKALVAGTHTLGAEVASSTAPDVDSAPGNGLSAGEDDDDTRPLEVTAPATTTTPPTTDPPKSDPPKADPPKTDPPKVDPPKLDPTPLRAALRSASVALRGGLPRVTVDLLRAVPVRIALSRRGATGRDRALGAVTRSGARGRSILTLPRRITGRRLRKGVYRVTVVADGVRIVRSLRVR